MSRVYVGNLSSRATERDLEHFFRGFGRIRDVMLKDGFGFVVNYSYYKNLSIFYHFRNSMIRAMLRTQFMNKMAENCAVNELSWKFRVVSVRKYLK